ncbi:MAG: hypothetical protein LBE56_06290 [Tannerella sp.]|jgi:hypothetical protein|nr:hypothetical protein [Tannerella sp.]
MKQDENDILKTMFSRMPEEKLSPAFQTDMMERIRKEALLVAKRRQILQVLLLIGASISMIGLAIATFVYLKIPQMSSEWFRTYDWQIPRNFPNISIPHSYLIFGFLVVILLFADYLFRQVYYKRHGG